MFTQGTLAGAALSVVLIRCIQQLIVYKYRTCEVWRLWLEDATVDLVMAGCCTGSVLSVNLLQCVQQRGLVSTGGAVCRVTAGCAMLLMGPANNSTLWQAAAQAERYLLCCCFASGSGVWCLEAVQFGGCRVNAGCANATVGRGAWRFETSSKLLHMHVCVLHATRSLAVPNSTVVLCTCFESSPFGSPPSSKFNSGCA
jgi:hypothetical protein